MIRSRSPEESPASERAAGAPAVHVIRDGKLGARCAELLIGAGARVTTSALGTSAPEALPDAVIVLATDRPHPAAALALDAAAFAAQVAWTSGTLLAHELRIGPSIVPGRTPCFACFSRRVRSVALDLEAHDALEALGASGDLRPWFQGELAAVTEQAAALLAAEALALSKERCAPEPPRAGAARMGRFWECDVTSGALRARRFARVGLCGRCAAGEHAAGRGASLAGYFAEHPLAIAGSSVVGGDR